MRQTRVLLDMAFSRPSACFDFLAIDLDDDIAGLDADAAGVGIKLRFEDHDALRLRNGKLVGDGGRKVRDLGAAQRMVAGEIARIARRVLRRHHQRDVELTPGPAAQDFEARPRRTCPWW